MQKEFRGDQQLYNILSKLKICYDYYEHSAAATVEEASKYWMDIKSSHCKNLFFRNHKGDKHYLVILEFTYQMNIRDLELSVNQGKLSFASPQRMMKFLGLTPGSVSPFGLINDSENHVHVFIDANLRKSEKISFHPNINTATLVISNEDFLKFLHFSGNSWEYLKLYD